MAQQGVKQLALADLNLEELHKTKDALWSEVAGVRVILIEMDVSVETSVSEGVAQAATDFGRIDYAVNCAGITGPTKPTEHVEFAEWQRLLPINLSGVWIC